MALIIDIPLRILTLVSIILVFVLPINKFKWLDLPEAQVIIGVVLILLLVIDSLSGIVLLFAVLVAFLRLNHITFGKGWFKQSNTTETSNSKLMPPYVTEKNLLDAQTNVFDATNLNVGYKPNGVDFGAQGMDPVKDN